MTEKRCRRCGLVKSLDDFPVDRHMRDNRSSMCRKCSVEKATKWSQKNPERRREINRQAAARKREEKRVEREEALDRILNDLVAEGWTMLERRHDVYDRTTLIHVFRKQGKNVHHMKFGLKNESDNKYWVSGE